MMTSPRGRFVMAAAAVVALTGAPCSTASAQSAAADTVDASAVRTTVHAFHDALAAGDSAAALAFLHPDVRVFEGGHAETLAEYRAGHLGADMAFSSAVDRELLTESASVEGDRALYLGTYRMVGTFRGRDLRLLGTETMVLARTSDGWRIRHIHWSSREAPAGQDGY